MTSLANPFRAHTWIDGSNCLNLSLEYKFVNGKISLKHTFYFECGLKSCVAHTVNLHVCRSITKIIGEKFKEYFPRKFILRRMEIGVLQQNKILRKICKFDKKRLAWWRKASKALQKLSKSFKANRRLSFAKRLNEDKIWTNIKHELATGLSQQIAENKKCIFLKC